MRIRWRGLELPSRVVRDGSVSTDLYGRFIAEPFEHGFGTTVGNSLRRILLSSLEGAAVTSVKIEGVSHAFYSMDGVLEDVTDILLNIKGCVVSVDGDEPKTMKIRRDKVGEVKAGDIEADTAIEIVDPDHHIATLTDDVPFNVDMVVKPGRGYATSMENRSPEQDVTVIPIDSIYSPVLRVRYRTEDMRVGQRTNYDRLILEIWTRGTLRPEDALVEAGCILRKHLNPFVMYHELGEEMAKFTWSTAPDLLAGDSTVAELIAKPVSALNLSVRAMNCLDQAQIGTIGDLIRLGEDELLGFRSFGKASLHELQRKLSDLNLRLGMKPGDGPEPGSVEANPSMSGLAAPEEADSVTGPEGESASSGPMEVFTMGD